MDINEPIPYRWTLGWDEGMVSPRPTVNRLLKAMIEKTQMTWSVCFSREPV